MSGQPATADEGLAKDGPRAAAFLDFDRTLVDVDAGVLWGRSFARDRWQAVADEPWPGRLLAYLDLLVEGATLLVREGVLRLLHKLGLLKRSTLVRRAYRFLEGLQGERVRAHMAEVFQEDIEPRFHAEVVAEVRRHREAGRDVVLVTTGMRPLVEHARTVLGEVDVIAVDLLERDGRLTGEVEGPLWGGEKVEAVRRFARERGIDLTASYAYSDHVSDVPLLEAVGHPVAVNPGRRLARVADRRGWRVLETG